MVEEKGAVSKLVEINPEILCGAIEIHIRSSRTVHSHMVCNYISSGKLLQLVIYKFPFPTPTLLLLLKNKVPEIFSIPLGQTSSSHVLLFATILINSKITFVFATLIVNLYILSRLSNNMKL